VFVIDPTIIQPPRLFERRYANLFVILNIILKVLQFAPGETYACEAPKVNLMFLKSDGSIVLIGVVRAPGFHLQV
jgi:hypothetical protein